MYEGEACERSILSPMVSTGVNMGWGGVGLHCISGSKIGIAARSELLPSYLDPVWHDFVIMFFMALFETRRL